MISNADKAILGNDSRKEEACNYALIVFLRSVDMGMEVNLENFRSIVHLHFILICNGFGIADD